MWSVVTMLLSCSISSLVSDWRNSSRVSSAPFSPSERMLVALDCVSASQESARKRERASRRED